MKNFRKLCITLMFITLGSSYVYSTEQMEKNNKNNIIKNYENNIINKNNNNEVTKLQEEIKNLENAENKAFYTAINSALKKYDFIKEYIDNNNIDINQIILGCNEENLQKFRQTREQFEKELEEFLKNSLLTFNFRKYNSFDDLWNDKNTIFNDLYRLFNPAGYELLLQPYAEEANKYNEFLSEVAMLVYYHKELNDAKQKLNNLCNNKNKINNNNMNNDKNNINDINNNINDINNDKNNNNKIDKLKEDIENLNIKKNNTLKETINVALNVHKKNTEKFKQPKEQFQKKLQNCLMKYESLDEYNQNKLIIYLKENGYLLLTNNQDLLKSINCYLRSRKALNEANEKLMQNIIKANRDNSIEFYNKSGSLNNLCGFVALLQTFSVLNPGNNDFLRNFIKEYYEQAKKYNIKKNKLDPTEIFVTVLKKLLIDVGVINNFISESQGKDVSDIYYNLQQLLLNNNCDISKQNYFTLLSDLNNLIRNPNEHLNTSVSNIILDNDNIDCYNTYSGILFNNNIQIGKDNFELSAVIFIKMKPDGSQYDPKEETISHFVVGKRLSNGRWELIDSLDKEDGKYDNLNDIVISKNLNRNYILMPKLLFFSKTFEKSEILNKISDNELNNIIDYNKQLFHLKSLHEITELIQTALSVGVDLNPMDIVSISVKPLITAIQNNNELIETHVIKDILKQMNKYIKQQELKDKQKDENKQIDNKQIDNKQEDKNKQNEQNNFDIEKNFDNLLDNIDKYMKSKFGEQYTILNKNECDKLLEAQEKEYKKLYEERRKYIQGLNVAKQSNNKDNNKNEINNVNDDKNDNNNEINIINENNNINVNQNNIINENNNEITKLQEKINEINKKQNKMIKKITDIASIMYGIINNALNENNIDNEQTIQKLKEILLNTENFQKFILTEEQFKIGLEKILNTALNNKYNMVQSLIEGDYYELSTNQKFLDLIVILNGIQSELNYKEQELKNLLGNNKNKINNDKKNNNNEDYNINEIDDNNIINENNNNINDIKDNNRNKNNNNKDYNINEIDDNNIINENNNNINDIKDNNRNKNNNNKDYNINEIDDNNIINENNNNINDIKDNNNEEEYINKLFTEMDILDKEEIDLENKIINYAINSKDIQENEKEQLRNFLQKCLLKKCNIVKEHNFQNILIKYCRQRYNFLVSDKYKDIVTQYLQTRYKYNNKAEEVEVIINKLDKNNKNNNINKINNINNNFNVLNRLNNNNMNQYNDKILKLINEDSKSCSFVVLTHCLYVLNTIDNPLMNMFIVEYNNQLISPKNNGKSLSPKIIFENVFDTLLQQINDQNIDDIIQDMETFLAKELPSVPELYMSLENIFEDISSIKIEYNNYNLKNTNAYCILDSINNHKSFVETLEFSLQELKREITDDTKNLIVENNSMKNIKKYYDELCKGEVTIEKMNSNLQIEKMNFDLSAVAFVVVDKNGEYCDVSHYLSAKKLANNKWVLIDPNLDQKTKMPRKEKEYDSFEDLMKKKVYDKNNPNKEFKYGRLLPSLMFFTCKGNINNDYKNNRIIEEGNIININKHDDNNYNDINNKVKKLKEEIKNISKEINSVCEEIIDGAKTIKTAENSRKMKWMNEKGEEQFNEKKLKDFLHNKLLKNCDILLLGMNNLYTFLAKNKFGFLVNDKKNNNDISIVEQIQLLLFKQQYLNELQNQLNKINDNNINVFGNNEDNNINNINNEDDNNENDNINNDNNYKEYNNIKDDNNINEYYDNENNNKQQHNNEKRLKKLRRARDICAKLIRREASKAEIINNEQGRKELLEFLMNLKNNNQETLQTILDLLEEMNKNKLKKYFSKYSKLLDKSAWLFEYFINLQMQINETKQSINTVPGDYYERISQV